MPQVSKYSLTILSGTHHSLACSYGDYTIAERVALGHCCLIATEQAWRLHPDELGQTGTRIAPEIYIACGVSGAIQHMVGCKGSKQILAINTDREAPIVARADYAIIDDLHKAIPAICAEIRKGKG